MQDRVARLFRAACAPLVLAGSACGVIENLTQPQELSIRRFTVSPAELNAGGTATLSWEVDGAESVQLDNGIGTVVEKGTHTLYPRTSLTVVLTARKGTATATASLQLVVHPGTIGGAPPPSPTPSIAPAPSPTPSIAPAPSPSPSAPAPGPSPSPGAPVVPKSCGPKAPAQVACGLSVSYPSPPDEGECLAINSVELSGGCPATFNTTRTLTFTVTAQLAPGPLAWRRGAASTNLLMPDGGSVQASGQTRVTVTELVLDSQSVIEIGRGGTVLASLTVKSR